MSDNEVWKTIKTIYCPFCGKKMEEDIHDDFTDKNGSLKMYDVWICRDCEVTGDWVVFDRYDVEDMV